MTTGDAPSKIKLHRRSQVLEVCFGYDCFDLTAEYLRVYSPSAEVKGHGSGQEVLQLNKSSVAITGVETQGNYAIRLIFSDRHDSGIYTWRYLRELGENKDAYWRDYLERVAQHEANRGAQPVRWVDPS